jgi:hypothetical protein
MKNLSQMMKQAQEMQVKMQEMQARLVEAEVTGVAGGGLITVTLDGKGTLRKIHIDPTVVDPSDVAMLEDLVTAAFNDAKTKVEALVADKMSEVTGGMQLPPGMKLSF